MSVRRNVFRCPLSYYYGGVSVSSTPSSTAFLGGRGRDNSSKLLWRNLTTTTIASGGNNIWSQRQSPPSQFITTSSSKSSTTLCSLSFNSYLLQEVRRNRYPPMSLGVRFMSSYSGGGGGGGGDYDSSLQQQTSLPPIMNYPPIVWPRFMNAIRNWFFINFIIKPYFDKEFSMKEFLVGAKQATALVANKMSEGKLEDLEGLVDPTALAQIKESLSKFTVFQQQLLKIAAEDIFFTFPYQIGIIIPDTEDNDENPREEQYAEGVVKRPPQTRHVEITISLHVLRGVGEKSKGQELGPNNFNFQEFAQDERNKLNFMVCNYRFFRDFTEGSDPSWIINMVNQFLPLELSAAAAANANRK